MQSVAQSSSSSSKTYRHTKTHSKWRRCDGKMSTDGASVRTLPNVTPVSAVLAHKASSNFVFQAHNARTVCGVVAVFVAELCYYLEARTFMVHSLRPMRTHSFRRAHFSTQCVPTHWCDIGPQCMRAAESFGIHAAQNHHQHECLQS